MRGALDPSHGIPITAHVQCHAGPCHDFLYAIAPAIHELMAKHALALSMSIGGSLCSARGMGTAAHLEHL